MILRVPLFASGCPAAAAAARLLIYFITSRIREYRVIIMMRMIMIIIMIIRMGDNQIDENVPLRQECEDELPRDTGYELRLVRILN